jgi:hypothetical protein
MKYTLRLTKQQGAYLSEFLFKDDNENAMLGLCGYDSFEEDTLLMAHKLIEIPEEICSRYPDFISWPTEFSEKYLKEARETGLTIVKFHSHPMDYRQFSMTDNKSDKDLFDYFNAYFDDGRPVASLIMVPDGFVFGRVILPNGDFIQISKISVIGNDLKFHYPHFPNEITADVFKRNEQVFGTRTVNILKKVKVGIVGASGLGSFTIEELARLGVGELIIIDMDKIEDVNLNRIPGSTTNDIGKYKVSYFQEKLDSYGVKVKVVALKGNVVLDEDILRQLATCDQIFGCTDSYLSRDIINRLATFYINGYTDLAVGLEADGKGGIDTIVGWVRYLVPGGSSLATRKMYDSLDLERESLQLENPKEYKRKLEQKYIKKAKEKSPPVISLNATIASLGVTDFLHRIHGFKYKESLGFCLDFCENKIEDEHEYPDCPALKTNVGKAYTQPFLNLFGFRKMDVA